MTLDEAEEIFAYWERHPPVHQVASIIAQILGWKPSGRSATAMRAASSDEAAPVSLLLTGVFSPPDAETGADFAALARMASAGSA